MVFHPYKGQITCWRIWFCPLLPQGSCKMLSRSCRPNFNSWSQIAGLLFWCTDPQNSCWDSDTFTSQLAHPIILILLSILKSDLEACISSKVLHLYKEWLQWEFLPAALGYAHFPSRNSSDCTRRLLQSSPREPDAAKESGEPLKQRASDGQCPYSQLGD